MPSKQNISRPSSLVPALVFGAMLFPWPFKLAELALSPIRLVLIGMLPPLLIRFVIAKKTAGDWLFLSHVGWVILSLAVNHGVEIVAKSGGMYVIEVFGGFLAGRYASRSFEQCASTIRVLSIFVICTVPLAFIEFFTGNNYFIAIVGRDEAHNMRFGFLRAQGPFEHPILYGMACSAAFAIVICTWKSMRHFRSLGAIAMIASVIGVCLSLSSGSFLTMFAEIGGYVWYRYVTIQKKWQRLACGLLILYTATWIVAGRSPTRVFLGRFSLVPQTAYYRMTILDEGMLNIQKHPVFGIGFGDWERLSYMSSSIDNYWLLVCIRYGIPAGVLLGLSLCIGIWKGKDTFGASDQDLRFGVKLAMIGLCLGGTTVDYWSQGLVLFSFVAGMLIGNPNAIVKAKSPARSKRNHWNSEAHLLAR